MGKVGMSIGKTLRGYWLSKGAEIRPGASLRTIEYFEDLNAVKFPLDMRDAFLAVDGMEENTSDNTDLLFCFWPLHRLIPVNRQFVDPRDKHYTSVRNPSSFFCFADYMIEAEVFSIDLSPSARSSNLVVGWEGKPKASSYSEFIDRYFNNPESLLAK